jgi:hypothetical protein
MDKDKLVLADGTEITLEDSQGIGTLVIGEASRSAAGAVWAQLTPDNLAEISIKNAAETVTGTYTDMLLDHVTGTDKADGTALLTVNLREKTNEEILQEKVAALEAELAELKAGQGTQDEAISDLGQAVSDITGGGEQ